MLKKIYFGTNLKMYKTIKETKVFLDTLTDLTKDMNREDFELFVIPSYTSLPDAVKIENRGLVHLGAQNMGWEDEGQFTGEISPVMLKELALDLVMIGHSERRHVFGETDERENWKVLAARRHGFTALLCVGETGEEKENNISDEVLRTQLKVGFKDVPAERAFDGDTPKIWVAYEPVWAIGVGGKPASAEYAEAKHQVIRDCLVELFGARGEEIPVLYGGSVNPQNAEELIVRRNIDGLFVGRSAWDAEKFNDLIRLARKKAGR